MVPRSSLFLAGAALALLGASANAQSQASGKVFSRYNKPLKSVSLDLATGTITRGPAVNNRSATTTVDFNNNDLGGFVGVDTGNGFCEWFDAAVKGFAGNGSDLMNNIVFAYCSALLAPGSGGPGGSVKLGFYEGYTWFGGAPTTTVAAFTLTGLPANTGSSSFFGGFRCFFIQVIFANMVAFADGPIGYSWKFLDVGTTGVLGGTWPFLSCTTSCSGIITVPDGQGMADILDEYCPPGNRLATFTFGTTSGSFTSMSMDVREVTDFTATEVGYNATTSPNGDTLATAELKAVVNSTWTATLARSPATGAGTFNVKVRTTRISLPNGVTPPAPVQGRLLISGPVLASINGTHNGTTGSAPSQSIPPSFSLVCFHYVAQATATGGGVKLTSALDGTTGTN